MNGQLRIDSMFAFIALDSDGTEGVISYEIPGRGPVPLVGADMARVEALRPVAQRLCTMSGQPVTLVHFTQRTEIERLQP